MATEYTHWATLPGYKDGVLSLTISPDSKYLVVTGYAGVAIWNVAERRALRVPSLTVDARGKHLYTCSSWLFFQDSSSEVLVLGSRSGDLQLWKWDAAQNGFVRSRRFKNKQGPSETLSMDVYQSSVPALSSGMVVAAMASHRVVLLDVSAQLDVTELFSITMDQNCRPQNVKFDAFAHTFLVFAQAGGVIQRFDCLSGARVGMMIDGPQVMACVAVDPRGQRFVAYTGQSLEVVSMNHAMASHSIPCDATDILYPMHVAFAEGGEVLLFGTDKGRAMVYDMNTFSQVQTLAYPRGGLVQHVAACTTNTHHIVAYAGSSIEQESDVILYRKKIPRGAKRWTTSGVCKCMFVMVGVYWMIVLVLLVHRFIL
ncbi:WD40-repeat-containing domain protein [Schizophyllum commune]